MVLRRTPSKVCHTLVNVTLKLLKYLQSCYDRRCLIHQMHVHMILESPTLKDGTGKELCLLHDMVQQHLRALKAMEYELSGPFIMSILELKLDVNIMFEWQKHSEDATNVFHYQELLEFINLRDQASETSISNHKGFQRKDSSNHMKKTPLTSNPVTSFAASTGEFTAYCVLCKANKHPLYTFTRYKSLPHAKMMSTLKANNLSMNCLRLHRCKKCQQTHYTLLHIESEHGSLTPLSPSDSITRAITAAGLTSNTTHNLSCSSDAPDGSCMEARAILDSASSVSFVSERLVQILSLSRSHQNTRISGVAGLSHNSPFHSIAKFKISSTRAPRKGVEVTAVVVPCITCDLPLYRVPFNPA